VLSEGVIWIGRIEGRHEAIAAHLREHRSRGDGENFRIALYHADLRILLFQHLREIRKFSFWRTKNPDCVTIG
jgi:hypothetical protein